MTFENTGWFELLDGASSLGQVANTDAIDVAASASLTIDGNVKAAGTMNFQGAGAVVDIYGAKSNAIDYKTEPRPRI